MNDPATYKTEFDKQIGSIRVTSYGTTPFRYVNIKRTDNDDIAINNLSPEEVRDLRYALERVLEWMT